MSASELKFRFLRETFDEVIHDIEPLIRKHYEEIARFKDIELKPDFNLYKSAESLGNLRIFTARTNDHKLIGYALFFLRDHPHYSNSTQASQDLLFIDPDARGFGLRFISWCDDALREEGVEVVYHMVTERFDFSAILMRLGYEPHEQIYARRLK